ncbi:hypothetical protein HPB49_019226 [Dermacentor silvarum]|uniref:Uncharacterized protein n=1 Tax=Dermacentor silvarum TaxID=543639 RepID=A0ACB8D7I5_DERSI|nr:hypothetical protein HPB49_019226 [Dermacentor silvarum]
MGDLMRNYWDAVKNQQPTPQCLQRVQRDLVEFHANPPQGVFVFPEENDMSMLHAIVVGCWDTPLEGGFFRLQLKCPPDYPTRPPRVRFLTGAGKVLFNWHIFGEYICLSLLGTDPDGPPSWSSTLSIGSLLVSIQSFLADGAMEIMRYNTIRVAVCETLEDCTCHIIIIIITIIIRGRHKELPIIDIRSRVISRSGSSMEMDGWLRRFWDTAKDGQPTPWCLHRLQRDLMELHADPPPGVFVAPEENDMSTLHAVIVGPWGTPLEGGLFRLQLKCPPDYPMVPPLALFMTGEGDVSFSSHIYGESICLSILCTAPGPSWSPALTVGSLLVSIQSLMTDGAEESVRHDTIRVAVCGTLEDCLQESTASPTMPSALSKQVLKYFAENYAKYEDAVQAQISSGGLLSWLTGNLENILRTAAPATSRYQKEGRR